MSSKVQQWFGNATNAPPVPAAPAAAKPAGGAAPVHMHDGVPCTHDHSADAPSAADEHARIANTKKRIEEGPGGKSLVTARTVCQHKSSFLELNATLISLASCAGAIPKLCTGKPHFWS